ncbi:DUF4392 domain-containing protein [Halonotius terrestris]|uniref:DUF4392 domain-containing protein n=1 Tax=Halonotius terrestris TaxID=2487750 RepID=A0A8J8TE13_9EURY|nr:DUF4392 domain-containing protein [Halonotius terrestris]TQQ83709.1 DUF4392 domain-containing protein [Halonotius terrestris]
MFAAIDQQLTVDLGGRNTQQLYAAARDDEPLVEAAAGPLQTAADAGETVLLTTGFPIPPSNEPETDGPLGTVVLAGALRDLGAKPIVVTEPRGEATITAVADALGIDSPELVSLAPPESVAAGATSDATPETTARSLLDSYEPGAVVAIEKPGRTADGSYRTAAGEDITALVTAVDPLFAAAHDRGIPTVAVGDGGNEVGMGRIRSAVETHVDGGETIACVTPVDELVVAAVSNWGAYGLVAALSIDSDRNLLHTGDTERALLAAAVDAGCIDGVTGAATESVDGIPAAVHANVVDILQHCVTAQ